MRHTAVAEPTGSPLLVDYVEAGRLLGQSRRSVVRLVQAGRLPLVKLGHSARIPRAAVEELVAELVAASESQDDHDRRARPVAEEAGVDVTRPRG